MAQAMAGAPKYVVPGLGTKGTAQYSEWLPTVPSESVDEGPGMDNVKEVYSWGKGCDMSCETWYWPARVCSML